MYPAPDMEDGGNVCYLGAAACWSCIQLYLLTHSLIMHNTGLVWLLGPLRNRERMGKRDRQSFVLQVIGTRLRFSSVLQIDP